MATRMRRSSSAIAISSLSARSSPVFRCLTRCTRLVAPEPSLLADPIYGFSSHAQFHFSVAAGYFLWASAVMLVYRGAKVKRDWTRRTRPARR